MAAAKALPWSFFAHVQHAPPEVQWVDSLGSPSQERVAAVVDLRSIRIYCGLRSAQVGLEKTTRFYQASTSELYGMVQDWQHPRRPLGPGEAELCSQRNRTRAFITKPGSAAERDDSLLSTLALCRGEALRLLDCRDLGVPKARGIQIFKGAGIDAK